jgi:hypothetical protein
MQIICQHTGPLSDYSLVLSTKKYYLIWLYITRKIINILFIEGHEYMLLCITRLLYLPFPSWREVGEAKDGRQIRGGWGRETHHWGARDTFILYFANEAKGHVNTDTPRYGAKVPKLLQTLRNGAGNNCWVWARSQNKTVVRKCMGSCRAIAIWVLQRFSNPV